MKYERRALERPDEYGGGCALVNLKQHNWISRGNGKRPPITPEIIIDRKKLGKE